MSTRTDQVFKKVISVGEYNRGNFMCLALTSACDDGHINFSETAQAQSDINDFMRELNNGGYLHSCLTTALGAWFKHNNVGATPSFQERLQLCVDVYNNWDDRWKILLAALDAGNEKARQKRIADNFRFVCSSDRFVLGNIFMSVAIDDCISMPHHVRQELFQENKAFIESVSPGCHSLGSALIARGGDTAGLDAIVYEIYTNWESRKVLVENYIFED